jgi:hypothetical protein
VVRTQREIIGDLAQHYGSSGSAPGCRRLQRSPKQIPKAFQSASSILALLWQIYSRRCNSDSAKKEIANIAASTRAFPSLQCRSISHQLTSRLACMRNSDVGNDNESMQRTGRGGYCAGSFAKEERGSRARSWRGEASHLFGRFAGCALISLPTFARF